MNMKYNTNEEKLRLPEYGRLVQRMVQHAVEIEDRATRQAYAARIVRIMGQLQPKMRNVPDFQHKLWDHLAYISDYRLDIDWPVEVQRREEKTRPTRLSYPQSRIRYRHYGKLLERAIEKMQELPEGAKRERQLYQIADRMKRNLAAWKGDGATDEKVAHDIAAYTDGKVQL